jgi:hypothetical protein
LGGLQRSFGNFIGLHQAAGDSPIKRLFGGNVPIASRIRPYSLSGVNVDSNINSLFCKKNIQKVLTFVEVFNRRYMKHESPVNLLSQ